MELQKKEPARALLILSLWTPLDVQPEEVREGKLTNINAESGCNEKDDNVPEEVTPGKYFKLKKLLEIFHDIQSAKDKILKAIKS